MKTWIQTYSGKKLDLLDPDYRSIEIVDIAHALAATRRFGGHTVLPYSVAEHSVLVSMEASPKYRREAFAHDFVEYAIGDITSPLKQAMHKTRKYLSGENITEIEVIESRMRIAMTNRFGLPPSYDRIAEVLRADLAVLAAEQQYFFPEMVEDWGLTVPASDLIPTGLVFIDAKKQFLAVAEELGFK